jgi:hypothetical protein
MQIAPRSPVGQLTGTPGYGGGVLAASSRAPRRPAARQTGSTLNAALAGLGASSGPDDSILALVKQIIALESAPLTAAENQRQDRIASQQADMRAAQTALVAQLQKGAQTGGQAYDQAIASTDALGRQGASYFQSQSPDAANQAVLKAIGAPVQQQQAVGAQNAALFNGGPGYVLGAQIPGASLNAQKAAQVSYLAGLPTVAALQGNTGIRASQQADEAAHQTYMDNLMRVTAQTPQLVQQYQNQAIQQANSARSAAAAAAAALANRQYLLAKEGFTRQQIDLATTKEKHAYDVASRNADTASQRAGTYQQSVNQTGAYDTGRLTNAANAAAGKAAAAKLKKGKQRQSYFYTQRSRAITAAKQLYGTPQKGAKAGSLSFTTPTGQTYKQPTSREAYNKLYATYGPPLLAQGFKQATIRQMLNNALRIAGYKTPGAGNYRGKH